jgi:hypothetical protein
MEWLRLSPAGFRSLLTEVERLEENLVREIFGEGG